MSTNAERAERAEAVLQQYHDDGHYNPTEHGRLYDYDLSDLLCDLMHFAGQRLEGDRNWSMDDAIERAREHYQEEIEEERAESEADAAEAGARAVTMYERMADELRNLQDFLKMQADYLSEEGHRHLRALDALVAELDGTESTDAAS